MIAYNITYSLKKDNLKRNISIDAKDISSAKKKIGKKHGYKDGRNVTIIDFLTIGYF